MTRTLAVRRSLVALVLPMTAVGLAACNGDDSSGDASSSSDSSSPSEASSSAGSTESTEPAGSSAAAGDSIEPAAFVDRIEAGIERSTTAHVSMSLDAGSVGTMEGNGVLDYTDSSSPGVAMKVSSDAFGGDMDVRLVDRVMYVSIPKMTHSKFIKMDLDDPNNPLGAAGMGGLDPLSSLQALEKGTRSVTYVGQEEVDGRQLDHYRVSVDTAEMLDSMGQKSAGADVPATIDYELWLDDQQRVAKVSMDMGGSGTLEMSVTDWGSDVDIEAPPADQVMDMPGSSLKS